MKDTIMKLAEGATDEAWGACKYAKAATVHKDHPDVASTYAALAEQELTHAETLYGLAEKLLSSYMPGTPEHEELHTTVKYIRSKQVEKSNEARRYIAMYRGA